MLIITTQARGSFGGITFMMGARGRVTHENVSRYTLCDASEGSTMSIADNPPHETTSPHHDMMRLSML
jgi:hypothetical protein